jgi:hypothetical protein
VARMIEPEFQLWLEWEHFESWDNDNSDDDFFNMEVRLPGGRSYGLNVWTYSMLERAPGRWEDRRTSGRSLPPSARLVLGAPRSLLVGSGSAGHTVERSPGKLEA